MNGLTMKILCVIFVFFASTSALTLNCEFREVQWLAFGLNYQCHTEVFDVGSSQYVTNVSGVHSPNKTFDDVISIHVDNCTNLSFIPKGLLDAFPNLRGIYLEGCGISKLIGTELNEYPQLTLFALELSPLDYVPGNLFAQTPGMVLISFVDNKINGTGRNLLSNLNDLSQVYFENNVCISKNAPTPDEIPELIMTLNTDCPTTALSLNCEFREVQWLAFGLNYQCHTEVFDVGSSQHVTNVSGVHLPNKTFDDVISIHIDNCTNLSFIPKGLLDAFPNLRGIYLEGCGISKLIGTELNEYPQLTLFALELSPLDYVPGNLFTQTPGMVLISFADNKINGTGRNLLSNLNDLSQVYFEHNVCIDKNAPNPDEIPDLIMTLNTDCSSSGASEKFQSLLIISLLSGFTFL